MSQSTPKAGGGLDVRAAAKLAQKRGEAAAAPEAEPELVPREIPFQINYRGPDGKPQSAQVTSRIMNREARDNAARTRAILAGGPWTHLPAPDAGRIYALATLTFQVPDCPDWLLDAASNDPALLKQIDDVLTRHEQEYLFRDGAPGQGSSARPRILVRVLAGPWATGAGGDEPGAPERGAS